MTNGKTPFSDETNFEIFDSTKQQSVHRVAGHPMLCSYIIKCGEVSFIVWENFSVIVVDRSR